MIYVPIYEERYGHWSGGTLIRDHPAHESQSQRAERPCPGSMSGYAQSSLDPIYILQQSTSKTVSLRIDIMDK